MSSVSGRILCDFKPIVQALCGVMEYITMKVYVVDTSDSLIELAGHAEANGERVVGRLLRLTEGGHINLVIAFPHTDMCAAKAYLQAKKGPGCVLINDLAGEGPDAWQCGEAAAAVFGQAVMIVADTHDKFVDLIPIVARIWSTTLVVATTPEATQLWADIMPKGALLFGTDGSHWMGRAA